MFADSEDERELTIDMEERIIRERGKKEKRQRKRKREKKEQNIIKKHKHEDVLIIDAPSDQDQDQLDGDLSPVQYHTPPVQQPMAPATPSEKSKNIQTVDLSQLGDLFSVPVSSSIMPSPDHTVISVQPQSSPQFEDTKIFAKKSVPVPSKLPSMKKSLAEQVESAPIFILPDQVQGLTAVTSIASMTFQSGQEIPIIDCRPMLASQQRKGVMNEMTDIVDADDSDDHPTYEPLPEEKVTVQITGLDSPQKMTIQPETKVKVLTPNKISESLLKRHSGIPSVPCPHCPKLFMRGYNMRVHIDRVHNKTKPWQCQYCVKTFATTSDLKQHLSSHGMGKIHQVKISRSLI